MTIVLPLGDRLAKVSVLQDSDGAWQVSGCHQQVVFAWATSVWISVISMACDDQPMPRCTPCVQLHSTQMRLGLEVRLEVSRLRVCIRKGTGRGIGAHWSPCKCPGSEPWPPPARARVVLSVYVGPQATAFVLMGVS